MLILCRPVAAQQVSAYLSADSVRVGDRFSLTLVTEHTFTGDPIFPSLAAGEAFFGDLEVLNIQGSGSKLAAKAVAGTRIDSLIYEVTTFALDTAYVPSIPVFFVAGEDTSFFASYPLELPIISLVPEEADALRDLAPIAEFPVNPWPWIIGILLFIGAAAALYYYFMKHRQGQPIVLRAPEPELTPFEEAIQRLRTLEKTMHLEDAQQIKPFYVELTEILRVYLSRRLNINAMERTSHELLTDLGQLMHRQQISEEAAHLVRRVLQVSDLVKFADMHPPQEVGHQAFKETRKIVEVVEEIYQPAEQPAASDDESELEPEAAAPQE